MNLDVIDLESLRKFNRINKNPIIVWYYADWCGHCRNMEPEWKHYSKNCSNNVHRVKVKDTMLKLLKYKPSISGFPTIEFRNNNKKIDEFPETLDRNSDNLLSFTNKNLKNLKQSGYESDNENSDSSQDISKKKMRRKSKKKNKNKKKQKRKKSVRRKSI